MNPRAVLALFLLPPWLAFTADLPPTITPAEAARHVGRVVTVKGPVSSIKEMKSGMILVNMGAKPYPNQDFTATVHQADARRVKKELPDLAGDVISVTGRVTVYKEKPQIVVTEAKQVKLEQ